MKYKEFGNLVYGKFKVSHFLPQAWVFSVQPGFVEYLVFIVWGKTLTLPSGSGITL